MSADDLQQLWPDKRTGSKKRIRKDKGTREVSQRLGAVEVVSAEQPGRAERDEEEAEGDNEDSYEMHEDEDPWHEFA